MVDDKFVEQLFETLVKTDMGVEAAQEIADEIRTNFRARVVHMDEMLEQIKKQAKSRCWPSPLSRSAMPPAGRR